MLERNLINQYKPWIRKCSKIHKNRSRYVGFDDLESVGMMSIFEAIEKYASDRGASLSTYVMDTIKYNIITEVENSLEYSRRTYKIIRSLQKARMELGAKANSKRILEWSKTNYKSVPLTAEVQKGADESEKVTVQYLSVMDEYNPSYNVDYDGDLDKKMKLATVRSNLKYLTDKQRYVIERRLENKKYSEIGRELGVSRQAVDNLENSAVKRLKRYCNETN